MFKCEKCGVNSNEVICPGCEPETVVEESLPLEVEIHNLQVSQTKIHKHCKERLTIPALLDFLFLPLHYPCKESVLSVHMH